MPPGRFAAFWSGVSAALKPGGRVFFADGLFEQSPTATDHRQLDASGIVTRRLNDGREFEIVKVFYEPSALERRLRDDGWTGWVRSTETFFLYGLMTSMRP